MLKLYYKNISLFLKTAIVLATFYFIYRKLAENNIQDFYSMGFTLILPENIFFFLIALLLMGLNWYIESVKWKFLMQSLEKLTTTASVRATLIGIAAGVFTPNRTGEIPGKIFYLKHASRKKAALLTAAGSLSQLWVTACMGLMGVCFFIFYMPGIELGNAKKYLIVLIILLFEIALLRIYFTIPHLGRFHWLSSRFPQLNVLKELNTKRLLQLLLLSFLRYGIFSLQYVLLLKIFQVNIPLFYLVTLITISFFLVSLIPSYALSEIGVRGSVAILLFGMFSDNQWGIAVSSLLLWVINLAIPAFIGCFFIGELHFFRVAKNKKQ